MILKKYSKNQLLRKPSVPLKPNFFINVVVNACFLVYIFATFKSDMPESSGNSSFNKSFAFKLIFSFVGMKEVIINSFDINSKQRFKSFCDKQLKLLLKRKSEGKNILKKVFTSEEKFDILIIEGTTFQ